MNILCSTDNNYVPFCGIMLTSLFESNRDKQFDVYILSASLSSENKKILEDICHRYKTKATILTVDIKQLEELLSETLKNQKRLSIATYFRLFLEDLLPHDIERILYLDCDMCVAGDVEELYNEDFEGNALIAVADQDYFWKEDYSSRLKMPCEYTYCNAGALMINMKYWREHNMQQKFVDYISRNIKDLRCHDQDVLNATLCHAIKYAPLKYNFQTGFLYLINDKDYSDDFKKAIRSAVESGPVILHFTGLPKPWTSGSRHPYTPLYRHFQSLTQWRKPFKAKTSLSAKLRDLIIELVWATGIKKRPVTYIIPTQPFK